MQLISVSISQGQEGKTSDAMEETVYQTTLYYAVVWVAACVSGISRTLRNGDYLGLGHCARAGLFSGCLGFAIIGVLDWYHDGAYRHSVFYICVSAFVGLSGKEQDLIVAFMVRKAFKKIGIELDEEEDEDS